MIGFLKTEETFLPHTDKKKNIQDKTDLPEKKITSKP